MLVELVTDRVGPVVPWVLTVIGPDEKNLAGPTAALAVGALAVIGSTEPPAGRTTLGVGAPVAGWLKTVTSKE
jgi:ABC-type cobalamin transport system permease subunit